MAEERVMFGDPHIATKEGGNRLKNCHRFPKKPLDPAVIPTQFGLSGLGKNPRLGIDAISRAVAVEASMFR